jgi:phage shock protein E
MNSRMLLSIVLACASAPCIAGDAGTPAPAAASERAAIAPQALAERIASGAAPELILDTRTREEYDAGHVPRARLVPHDGIVAALDNLKAFQHAEIVIYCRSGRRSALAEATLREHGFTNITQLDGSWLAWEAAKLPVEKTSSERPQ